MDVLSLIVALVWVMEVSKVLVVVLLVCLIVGLLHHYALNRFANRRTRRVIDLLRKQ